MTSARRESVVFSDELTGRYLGPVTTDQMRPISKVAL
jgi:hypothetical protein